MLTREEIELVQRDYNLLAEFAANTASSGAVKRGYETFQARANATFEKMKLLVEAVTP